MVRAFASFWTMRIRATLTSGKEASCKVSGFLTLLWSEIAILILASRPPRASVVAQWERIHLPMQEMWVQSLGQEGPLEKEMATHSSILAWESPWIEEPEGLQSVGSQKSWT